jgi:hypothetical protein
MQGTLFKYGPGASHVALMVKTTPNPPPTHQPCAGSSGARHLVLVGGLTDGLLFAPYAQQLAAAVGELGWCLVQASLTSSYTVGVGVWGCPGCPRGCWQQLVTCVSPLPWCCTIFAL